MRFRLGLLIGGGIGYVLGARAGRERYEQIASRWEQMRAHPAYQDLSGQATNMADSGRKAVASGLRQGSNKLRNVSEETDDPPKVGI